MNVLLIFLPALLLHVYLGLCLRRVAAAAGVARASDWLPLFNLLLVPLRVAGRSPAWAAAFLAPGLNVLAWPLAWAEACTRLAQPRWLAVAMALPGVNLVALARLARLPALAGAGLLTLAGLAVLPAGTVWRHRQQQSFRSEVSALRVEAAARREAAARALARRGPEAAPAVDALRQALGDTEPAVRTAAAEALARIGPDARPAFADLVARLSDSDAAVRWSAGQALVQLAGPKGELAPAAALPPLLEAARARGGGPFPDPRLIDALAGFGAAAVPSLVRALEHADKSVRWHAAGALLHLGEAGRQAVPALIRAMEDREWEVRNAAGLGLESLAGPEHVPALMVGARAPNVETRYHAVRGLARMGPPAQAAVPVLVQALEDEDTEVRMHAARALGRIGRPEAAVAPLLRAVRDSWPDVRAAAAWSLGRLGQPQAPVTAALREALGDGDRDVRSAARHALRTLHAR